ncbi:MAG: hypothetical protein IPJ45_11420 [Ignavibacteria bacterium]|nr:hypothetical protein [Ignavibacteria bacterium]
MNRKILHLVTILTIALFMISVKSSFSQWTLAGAVSGVGTFPSISVFDQNNVWVAGGATYSFNLQNNKRRYKLAFSSYSRNYT